MIPSNPNLVSAFEWTIPADKVPGIVRLGSLCYAFPTVLVLIAMVTLKLFHFTNPPMGDFIRREIWMALTSVAIFLAALRVIPWLMKGNLQAILLKSTAVGIGWVLVSKIILMATWYGYFAITEPGFLSKEKSLFNVLKFFILNLDTVKMGAATIVMSISSSFFIFYYLFKRRLTPRSSGPDCVGPLNFFR